NVIPEIGTEPDFIDLNELVVGEGATTEVSLRRYTGADVKIKEVFSKTKFVTAEYNKKSDKIKIVIDPKTPIGKYRGRFTIKSDSEKSPVINVPLSFEVVGPLQIVPDALNFGRILKSKGKVSR